MDRNVSLGLQVVILAVVFFALHSGVLYVLDLQNVENTAGMALWKMYAFEFIFTILNIGALMVVDRKLPHHLGYVFLGLIALRGIASYVLIHYALEEIDHKEHLKYNFLACFMIFLILDAYLGYRILNKDFSIKEGE